MRDLKQFSLILILPALLALTACQKFSQPHYQYRKDEEALLKMTVEDILRLESNKQYDEIYDHYFSTGFKRTVLRRRFLMMSNCLERYLGDFNGFERKDMVFNRKLEKTDKGNRKENVDDVTMRVYRAGGVLREHFSFIREGMDFKLYALYWSSPREDFIRCIESAEKAPVESNPAVIQESSPTEPTPEKNIKNQSPENEKNGQKTAPVPPGTTPPNIGIAPSPQQPPQQEKPATALPTSSKHHKSRQTENSTSPPPTPQPSPQEPAPQQPASSPPSPPETPKNLSPDNGPADNHGSAPPVPSNNP